MMIQRRWFTIFFAVLALACKSKPELPELGDIQDFALTTQDNKPFRASDLRGQVWIAAFMFTRCPSVCPEITRTMRQLQQQGKMRGLQFTLVSFSVDPENDTPAVLKAYAEQYGADLQNWVFLTGDSKTLYQTANDSFKIGVEGKADPNANHFGIMHGSHFVLVDQNAKIRGFFRSSEPEQMQSLLDAAQSL